MKFRGEEQVELIARLSTDPKWQALVECIDDDIDTVNEQLALINNTRDIDCYLKGQKAKAQQLRDLPGKAIAYIEERTKTEEIQGG